MKIILKQLQLSYFKGIKSLTVDFNEHVQNIHGANETGKSTVFNAFLWLLFGKDMEGRTDYQVKTTDTNGVEIPKLDHEVVGLFEIDGRPVTMRRTLREKWVKPRGAAESQFSGNETVFEWNGVPMREKDYSEKINGIMKEDVFKLLTNPLYFNDGLKGYKIPDWQARRNVLIELAGEIRDEDVAADDPRFENLLKELKGKSLDEYKKQLAAQKKKIRETLDFIPSRIDEASRALPEAQDYAAIERAILAKNKEIADVDQILTDAAEAQKERNNQQLEKQNEIFGYRTRQQIIESEIRSRFAQDNNDREAAVKELRSNGRIKDGELTNLNAELKRLSGQKSVIEAKISQLRADWVKVDGQKPEEQKEDFKCPSCRQDLPADKVDEKNQVYQKYLTDFNDNKVKRLQEITSNGQELAGQLKGYEKSIAETNTSIAQVEDDIARLRTVISDLEAKNVTLNQQADQTIASQIETNVERLSLSEKIAAVEKEIAALKSETPDNADIKNRRSALVQELDELKKRLNTKDQIEAGNKRISELEKEEKDLSQQLVEIEGIEFIIQEFTRAKIDTLEERINHKFKYAKFKLFDRQVNGQEIECCETMYKGVVWGSLNTAAKVQIGLDIIRTLSEHYGVSAPIFIDNRESISAIPEIDSQVINLIVSDSDKHLRVA